MSAARIATVVFILMVAVFLSRSLNAIEQPQFELVEEFGELQIRKYQAHIVARTLVAESFEDAGNQGFRRLAGYIFGGNGQEKKIAMTAPVSLMPDADLSTEAGYQVTFTMPGEYSMEELPVPDDSRVEIAVVPARYMAVLPYKGGWSEDRYRTHESMLMSRIGEQARWSKQGEPTWSRYNPPFVPWFLRTNEVAVEVVPVDQVTP